VCVNAHMTLWSPPGGAQVIVLAVVAITDVKGCIGTDRCYQYVCCRTSVAHGVFLLQAAPAPQAPILQAKPGDDDGEVEAEGSSAALAWAAAYGDGAAATAGRVSADGEEGELEEGEAMQGQEGPGNRRGGATGFWGDAGRQDCHLRPGGQGGDD